MASGSPSKADQFRSSMVKGNIADSMFVASLEDDEDNDAAVNDGEDWTCDNCSKIVPGKKSRCKWQHSFCFLFTPIIKLTLFTPFRWKLPSLERRETPRWVEAWEAYGQR